MSDKPPRLPQSLLDAIKKGEEIGSKQLSPKAQELQRRIERVQKEFSEWMKDPLYRARFSKMLDMLREDHVESQRVMANLAPIPQRYSVVKILVHETDERFIENRHIFFSKQSSVQYVVGSTITLRSVHVEYEREGFTTPLWVWMDENGWIIRPGVLDRYVNKGQLRKV